MTVPRIFPAILLFGPGTAILPSRPASAPLARAAGGQGRRSRRAWARFTLDRSEHAGSASPVSGVAAVWLMEEFTMYVLTLVATCGLAARAVLFVPLSGAPPCASATPVLRGDGHGAVAVWQPDIAAAAHRFDIPEAWIAAVMGAESGGQATSDGRPIRSPAGAMGLMQVMPQTYAALRARYGLGADPYAPRDNILAGAAYLRDLLDRYGVPWFLAAYNAGPVRLDAFLHTGRALPVETQRYLAALAPQIDVTSGALRAAVVATESSTKSAPEAPVRSPSDAISAGLFATLVVHPEAYPARTVPPIVRPSQAPMAAPPEVTGGSATAGLEPRSVSESALNARGKSALFVALQ